MEAAAKKPKVGNDLTQGSIYKTLIAFAVPIILTNLIQQLYSMVDLMVIGQFVGSVGTVGISTGGEIADLVTPVAMGFSTAGQIYIAQLIGARDERRAKKTIGTLLGFMLGVSALLMLAAIVFSLPILHTLNCPGEALSQARAYMIITALCLHHRGSAAVLPAGCVPHLHYGRSSHRYGQGISAHYGRAFLCFCLCRRVPGYGHRLRLCLARLCDWHSGRRCLQDWSEPVVRQRYGHGLCRLLYGHCFLAHFAGHPLLCLLPERQVENKEAAVRLKHFIIKRLSDSFCRGLRAFSFVGECQE